jgi:hypothetical protein
MKASYPRPSGRSSFRSVGVPYGTPGFGARAMRPVRNKMHGRGFTFAGAGDQKYVSLTGRATVSNDRQKIKESLVDASLRLGEIARTTPRSGF